MHPTHIVSLLGLQPHPEGGWYREMYRSAENMTLADGRSRSVATSIYFMLQGNDRSLFHRIRSDEHWYFHQGNAIEIVYILNGSLHTVLLGNDFSRGETPYAVIPAGVWFASCVHAGSGYGLVSCAVAPGFDFADFEMARRSELLSGYPDLREAVEKFTV
jgi:predicted cupin superfamily sugar epimerase